MRSRLLRALLVLCTVSLLGAAPTSVHLSAPAVATAVPRPVVLGHYGGPAMAGGAVDVRTTIDALRHQEVTTYLYLISTEKQWRSFPAFLRAADEAGIEVWAYLVPPSSAPRPPGVVTSCWGQTYVNGGDYVSIFRSLGRLSSQLPALRAVVVDDFAQNASVNPSSKCPYFSVGLVRSMLKAARTYQPELAFYPVLYTRDLAGTTLDLSAYLPLADGVVLPYRGEERVGGRWSVDYHRRDNQASQVKLARSRLAASQRLVVMHYAIHRCSPGDPLPYRPGVCFADPTFFSSMVGRSLGLTAEGHADGVVVYRQPLGDVSDPRLRVARAHFQRWA